MVFISVYLTFKVKMCFISHFAATCYMHTDRRPQDLLVREEKQWVARTDDPTGRERRGRRSTAWAGRLAGSHEEGRIRKSSDKFHSEGQLSVN